MNPGNQHSVGAGKKQKPNSDEKENQLSLATKIPGAGAVPTSGSITFGGQTRYYSSYSSAGAAAAPLPAQKRKADGNLDVLPLSTMVSASASASASAAASGPTLFPATATATATTYSLDSTEEIFLKAVRSSCPKDAFDDLFRGTNPPVSPDVHYELVNNKKYEYKDLRQHPVLGQNLPAYWDRIKDFRKGWMEFRNKKRYGWGNDDPQAHGANHDAAIAYREYVCRHRSHLLVQQQQLVLGTPSRRAQSEEYLEPPMPVDSPVGSMSIWSSPARPYPYRSETDEQINRIMASSPLVQNLPPECRWEAALLLQQNDEDLTEQRLSERINGLAERRRDGMDRRRERLQHFASMANQSNGQRHRTNSNSNTIQASTSTSSFGQHHPTNSNNNMFEASTSTASFRQHHPTNSDFRVGQQHPTNSNLISNSNNAFGQQHPTNLNNPFGQQQPANSNSNNPFGQPHPTNLNSNLNNRFGQQHPTNSNGDNRLGQQFPNSSHLYGQWNAHQDDTDEMDSSS